MKRLLIQNGLLVDTEWTRHADILVEDSKIVRIAASIEASEVPEGTEIIHAEGLCVLPGIIDAHTHFHLVSRGTVTADSFEEGSRCAAYGGVTCVIDFADDDKKGDLAACAQERIGAMQAQMAVDFSLHQGLYSYREGLEQELAALKKAGVKVIKMFTTYRNAGYLVEKREELKAIFSLCKKLDLLVSVHCEDDATIQKVEAEHTGDYNPPAHALLRPSEAEARGIDTVGRVALELDMPLYVVHLSSKAGLQKVRELRAKGLRVIVETTPHYLFLNKAKLEGPDGALYVMTPPLRGVEDNEALQEAVLNGEIQMYRPLFVHGKRKCKQGLQVHPARHPGNQFASLVYSFAANSGRIAQQVNLLRCACEGFWSLSKQGCDQVGRMPTWCSTQIMLGRLGGYHPFERSTRPMRACRY